MKWNNAQTTKDLIEQDRLLMVRLTYTDGVHKEFHLCKVIDWLDKFCYEDSEDYDGVNISEIGKRYSSVEWVYLDDILKSSGLDNEIY